ncbi:class I SAM-dependent methyltransferase [Candidatus Thorarchaeota archaeon]|nr:MAG: class I SAM-dependent methyltransferase [Candidatus Thorarchaeota archaeon]
MKSYNRDSYKLGWRTCHPFSLYSQQFLQGVTLILTTDMFRKTIDYDKVSTVYDQVREGNPEMVLQLLEEVILSDSSLVLDVGCGTGNNTVILASIIPARIAGLDISYGMLQKAGEKGIQVPLVQAPADNIPFASDSFDFVYMTEVLHHLPDITMTFQEIHRVLKKTGLLCIVTQSHNQIDKRMTSRFFPGTAVVDKERYPDIDVIEAQLSKAGFSVINPKEYIYRPVRLGPEYLVTIEKRGFSMLHKISKEDYERGLEDLRAAFQKDEELLYFAEYSFVWATK